MIIVGCDTETTGLNPEKGDKIIEVCFSLYDLDLGSLKGRHLKTVTWRIDPKRTISPKAQAVHGIDISDLQGCPVWGDVAPKVDKILSAANKLICHNLAFDAPFLAIEQEAAGFGFPSTLEGFCTMDNGRWACADGKVPKLAELCWALHIPYEPEAAHAADYDVDRMMQCYFKGLELGFFKHNH